MLQFDVTVEITEDEARVLLSHEWARPDITPKTKDFFHINGLLTKGILINTSGQPERYQLRLSDWGKSYFSKVQGFMERKG